MRPSITEARARFLDRARSAINHRDVSAGVPFEWGLAGARGAWFRLLVTTQTPEDIAAAKKYLRADRDVVKITVERCP